MKSDKQTDIGFFSKISHRMGYSLYGNRRINRKVFASYPRFYESV